MRIVGSLLLLAILLVFPIVTQANNNTVREVSPHTALNCTQQQNMLASERRPVENARLIASTNIPVPSKPSTEQVTQEDNRIYVVQGGDTLSKIAARHNTTVYEIVQANNLLNPNVINQGQRLIIPAKSEVIVQNVSSNVKRVFSPIYDIWMEGEAVQGEALLIWMRTAPGTTVTAYLGNQPVHFRSYCNLLWGLVAFDALRDNPGSHNLVVRSRAYNGRRTMTTLPIYLQAGNYWSGSPVKFPAYKQHLLEPELIQAENDKVFNILGNVPERGPRWNGVFQYPVDSIITGPFGARGIVNGKATGYHEGLDLRCWHEVPFYAPAPGTVVLAEGLDVRGNTIYVDHGAGVASGYFHLSQLNVKVGDWVETGQLLGKCGDTGLTTAPHLHWEIRVNTRWVNPLPWVTRSFP